MKQEPKGYGYIIQQIVCKNHLNGAKYLGSLMSLMGSTKPQSIEEWERVYVRHVNENNLPLDWVIDRVTALAGGRYTRNEVKDAIKYLVINKTWEGRQRELDFYSWITKRTDYKVEHASDELDRRYAVDYLLYNGDVIVGAIQVKPESYFRFSGDDFDRNQMKYAEFKKRFGVKVIEVAFENHDVVIGKKKLMEVI